MNKEKINLSLRRLKFLIVGITTSGKSTITKNLPNPERIVYINCDTVQEPPFRNPGFCWVNIKNILDLPATLESLVEKNRTEQKYDLIVLDTLSSAITRYIKDYEIAGLGGNNAYSVWNDVATFFESLVFILNSSKLGYLVLTHAVEETVANETTLKAVTKGKQIGDLGIEHKFANVVAAKQVPITEISLLINDYLEITEADKFRGTKYVIQTLPSGSRTNYITRLCSPEGMFLSQEAFINNDIRALIALNDAYLDNNPNPLTVEKIWELPKYSIREVRKKAPENKTKEEPSTKNLIPLT